MVPNQSEDKILAKYFKHFDLDNTGNYMFYHNIINIRILQIWGFRKGP
jgi:hypothetical protein